MPHFLSWQEGRTLNSIILCHTTVSGFNWKGLLTTAKHSLRDNGRPGLCLTAGCSLRGAGGRGRWSVAMTTILISRYSINAKLGLVSGRSAAHEHGAFHSDMGPLSPQGWACSHSPNDVSVQSCSTQQPCCPLYCLFKHLSKRP